LIAAALGLGIACIGFDDVSGEVRYTFGFIYLWDGIKLVPALIGLFAISEMITLWVKGGSVVDDPVNAKIDFRQVLEGCWEPFRHWGVVLRGSAIGAIIGAIPGVGGTVAAFFAYTVASQSAKDPSSFGKGNIVGVIAPESANNSKDGGALVPTLAFGIPGGVEMAVFLGVLMLHGLTPGPAILTQHLDVIWALIIAMAIAGIIAMVATAATAGVIARLTLIDSHALVPIVLSFALVGSYSIENEFLDVVTTLVFGLIGYAFVWFDFPRITLPIALVLGPIMETSFFQSMAIGDGSWLIFAASLPAKILLALLIAACLFPMVRSLFRRSRHIAVGLT
jgi:putative tricarboxylic transport membrane protein